MRVTEEDLLYLKQSQPDLKFIPPNKIVGRVNFAMDFNPKQFKGYRIYNQSDIEESDTLIKDSYNIEIDTSVENYPLSCKCTDSRLEDHLKDIQEFDYLNIKNIHDLHINPDHTFCLGFALDFVGIDFKSLSLNQYLEDFIIPFLYYQSFLFRNKNEAWKGYGHGTPMALGEFMHQKRRDKELINNLVSSLPDSVKEQVMKFHVHYSNNCPCGSGKQWRNCHFKTAMGLKLIQKYMRAVG